MIKTNVAAGRDKDWAFKILLDEGFDSLAVSHEVRYVPSRFLADAVNPLTRKSQKFDPTQMFAPNALRFDWAGLECYAADGFLNVVLRQTDAVGHDGFM